MNNANVIKTMTIKELSKFVLMIMKLDCEFRTCTASDGTSTASDCVECIEKWLRADSQIEEGLLSDELKKLWKVH